MAEASEKPESGCNALLGGIVCKGTNCHAVNGVGHSAECIQEHDKLCRDAALADHIEHGGWKCEFCGRDGQDNVKWNMFCAYCHIHK